MIQASKPAVGMGGRKTGKEQIRKLTLAAMLTAVVVVLALLGTAIRFGVFNINLALVPIVIGAAMLGVWYGAWFGFVNAMVILLSGDAGAFFAVNVAGTIITVIAKGVFAGLLSGLIYRLVAKFNKYAAVVLAALVCPVVNTGIFLIGCRLFFWDTLTLWAQGTDATSTVSYVLTFLVGANFLVELGINVVLAPAIALILGFSVDKNTSLMVYGGALAVVGLGFAIFAVILMKNAWNDAAQNAIAVAVKTTIETASGEAEQAGILAGSTLYDTNAALGMRYLVMAIFSVVAFVGGTTMIGVGKARKSES
ncbi:MAG: ECF transporter S component [Oscillospiraceae bacterium]|nr:ECF transporter S component [Oscillospiraceae bacterium]